MLLSLLFWGLIMATHATALGVTPAGVRTAMAVAPAATPAVPYDFAQERVALEALYNATGGEHWSDSPANGWLVNPCHCQWVDVICFNPKACDDSPVGAVVRQTDKNLTGVLPSWNGDPGQGALPQLEVISLRDNPGLTGTLPDSWGGMKEMTTLGLVRCFAALAGPSDLFTLLVLARGVSMVCVDGVCILWACVACCLSPNSTRGSSACSTRNSDGILSNGFLRGLPTHPCVLRHQRST